MIDDVRLALVGDYDAAVPAHRAIPLALKSAGIEVRAEWKHTASLDSVEGYHGVWCVPASPYASEQAALEAIRFARTQGVPFLGTCGGFQHAVIEFARNVLGWHDAAHEETAGAGRMVIRRLSCSLVEVERSVRLAAGSQLSQVHAGAAQVRVGYRCNFGLDGAAAGALAAAGLRVTAWDDESGGEPRAVELDGHPFFVGTLWQPERAALRGEPVPLVHAFVKACAESAARP